MAIDKINSDALGNNLEIPGTEAAKMPIGTTAQRASAAAGDIRFNSTLSLMEYYDGTQWKSIDSPPLVTSISPTTESDASANITITGSNFQSGATVKFIGNDGTEYSSPSVTFNSATEVVATTPSTALTVANEPYDVQVSNPSGLSGILADGLDAGGLPAFTTASGTLGNIWDADRAGGYSLSPATATDPDGDTITYALGSGDSLPAGLSLNTTTGAITGTATAVGSDTTTTFDIEATSQGETSTREFSITVKAPVVTSYTSTGSGTFSVPSGLQTMDVLVVGAGGAGGAGSFSPGGGGAGGLIYRPAFPVTPSGTISYTVGSGGTGTSSSGSPTSGGKGGNGQDSVWGTLTAKGGGGGGGYDAANSGQPVGLGGDGGSGGGGGSSPGQPAPANLPTGQGYPYSGGTATQPQQPGDSGQAQYGFGNPGGDGGHDGGDWEGGGGGGGAATRGSPGHPGYGQGYTADSAGGTGKQYGISGSQVYYAGGGGGGGNTFGPAQHGGGGGSSSPGSTGQAGTANRGGGGGGGYYVSNANGASGGSGIVIVKY